MLKKIFLGLLVAVFALMLAIAAWLFFWVDILNLPNFKTLEQYRPYQTSYFRDQNGEIIGCIAEEWRDVVNPADPRKPLVAKVILGIEDRRFYERDLWIDVRAKGRALFENARHLRIVEGGSGIPEQLVKQLLSPEERSQRSVERKIKEFFLAWSLVKRFTKDEIFILYLNEIYLGDQRFGIEAASRHYFNKNAEQLSLAEAATFAGIIQAPETYSPRKHPEIALARRNEILKKLQEQSLLPEAAQEEYANAFKEPLILSGEFEKACNRAPHPVEEARDEVKNRTGLFFDELRRNEVWRGISVKTTIDSELQQYSEEGIRYALSLYHERQKEKAVPADGAAYALDNATGGIIMLVGSSDYLKIKRNNALNGDRQPGSAFKPIGYAAYFEEQLLQKKYTRENILKQPISNARIACKKIARPKSPDDWWRPQNLDEHKYGAGSYPAIVAIAKSINRPAIHAARAAGCALHPRVPQMARRLGIEIPLQPYLPTALGATGMPLNQLVLAYSVFPNYGIRRVPYIVQEVMNAQGKKLYEKTEYQTEKVFPDEIANYLSSVMIEALRAVVKFGTGHIFSELSQPIAGKTGTTNDYADAGFIGFTPEITFGVWIGDPSGRVSLGDRETGGKTAAPALKYALERWYQGREPVLFPDDIERWNDIIKNPDAFEKELEDNDEEEQKPENPAQ